MSTEELASRIMSKVELHIISYMPKPTCATKRVQWEWQVQQVKQKLAEKLHPQGLGIKIEV